MATPQRLRSLSVALLSSYLLASCTILIPDPIENNIAPIQRIEQAEIRSLVNDELLNVDPPIRAPVIAVYRESFTDQTGARRSNSQFATFSTAITQAPHAYLIRALKHAGKNNEGFFQVVERVGLDHVTKERQLIRSTRESFDEKQKLPPLVFAGLIMEGGVIGYESNTTSGGAGARYLGIGMSKAYRRDTVQVSLRTVSVTTGKVLMEVLVSKTILSASLDNDVFRFVANSTELVEVEGGVVRNESVNIALQAAIETAVLQTIKEGIEYKYWTVRR
jgi:curli production assembly/transport component CsgG